MTDSCICRTPEQDGSIKHSGRIVTFWTHTPDPPKKKWRVTVCWHHRKWYDGWKKAKAIA